MTVQMSFFHKAKRIMKVKRVHIKMFTLVRISQFKEEEEDVFCKKKKE